MKMLDKNKLMVQETMISLTRVNDSDFNSLTDIARVKNPAEPKDVVKNWLRSRSTIEFLGLWEKINNPDFKGVEFDPLRNAAGSNSFTLSPNKWIETTGAIGIKSTTVMFKCLHADCNTSANAPCSARVLHEGRPVNGH